MQAYILLGIFYINDVVVRNNNGDCNQSSL